MARISYNENGCWIWTGATSRGYAQAAIGGKVRQVHRVLYEHHMGPVPGGLPLDHLCHSNDHSCTDGRTCLHRRCVNPAHLDPVTHPVNMRRGIYARKTHCPQNHSYEGGNLYVDKTGRRHCKECRRANVRRNYQKTDGAAYMRAWRAARKAAQ
jgi:hypothetical protein